MDKPLKDWTLEEVRQYCREFQVENMFLCDPCCILYDLCNNYCENKKPAYWDDANGWNNAP